MNYGKRTKTASLIEPRTIPIAIGTNAKLLRSIGFKIYNQSNFNSSKKSGPLSSKTFENLCCLMLLHDFLNFK